MNYDSPLLLELKKLINSLVAEFRTRSRSSITDVDGYHRTTFFQIVRIAQMLRFGVACTKIRDEGLNEIGTEIGTKLVGPRSSGEW